MERIIKGRKRYNTDTAKVKAVFEAGEGDAWYKETLYRKKNGEYFLHGEGNKQSKYANSGYSAVGKVWRSGEEIIPLTYQEAQKWANKHLNSADYNRLFGNTFKAGKYPCHLMLPESTAEKLRRVSSYTGKQQAEIVAELIEKYL